MKGFTKRKGKVGAQTKIASHTRTAQVNVAISQAQVFVHVNVILNLERWCLSGVQHLNLRRQNLNLTGCQRFVRLTFGAMLNGTRDANRPLRTDTLGRLECLRCHVGIKQHLCQTLTVTKIHKDKTTKVTTAPNPAGKRNNLADILGTQFSAGMRVHTMLIDGLERNRF